jgi:Tol biopolymer transport system component
MEHTLQAGDQLSHYRIVSALGSGGMGEVYLAQDLTLERGVALKVLPAQLVRNDERLRRFVLEARAASSLNHPGIVTIHEIGSGEVERAGGASGPIHFIAMERIDGHTLHELIHEEKEDLRRLLGYLAQAADGIAKAHAAGIVHRDLKPGNIMVSRDGFAKVLDFGLAKLTEAGPESENLSVAPTRPAETSAGTLLGTVGYMSPEQVRGKSVDFRSDIFSFGCILYEAVTRKRAFSADSAVDTMHKILHDAPVETQELNPKAPADLRRLVRRCLAKSPDQRLQSMKDLAIELREIADNFDSLSDSASSGSGISAVGLPPQAPRSRAPLIGGAIAALLVITALAIGIPRLMDRGADKSMTAAPATALTVTSISGRAGVSGVAISGDGRYLAYPVNASGLWSIWVRQVTTGSEVQVVPPRKEFVGVPRFSVTGDYVFFLAEDPDRPTTASLERVPALGGPSTRVTHDVGYGFSLTPDGKGVGFVRPNFQSGKQTAIVRDLESGQEKTLATVSEPLIFEGPPTLSPDGRRFVTCIHTAEKGIHGQLATIDATSLAQTRFGPTGWEAGTFQWFPDGKALAMSAFKFGEIEQVQLFLVSYPDGRYRRITNDSNSYNEFGMTTDGRTIAAFRSARVSNVWSIPFVANARPKQLTFNSSSASAVGSFVVSADSSIAFSAASGHNTHLWTLDGTGQAPRQITPGANHEEVVRALPGGELLVARSGADYTAHIYLMDRDGGNVRPLVSGTGEWFQGLSPDGRTLLYTRVDSLRTLFAVPISGGEPRVISSSYDYAMDVSPDNRTVAWFATQELEGSSRTCLVASLDGGAPVATFTWPPESFLPKWTPDGTAITFLARKDGASNLFLQSLAGGPPRPITQLTEGNIDDYCWSPDGSRLVLERTIADVANLWSIGTGGRPPEPITDFATGSIFKIDISRDGRTIYFLYGNESNDIVLLSNFR